MDEYIKGILIGIDDASAAALFNGQNDITISARCGMALLDSQRGVYQSNGAHRIEQWALDALAAKLDDIQKDHCIQAIVGDCQRASTVISLLNPYVQIIQGTT
jgi:hypothetical protein